MQPFDLSLPITLATFTALLAAAAAYDVWKYRIPNFICGIFVLLFAATAITNPSQTDWWSHIGSGIAVLTGGLILYYFKWLGAGDVKFMSAIALFAGFGHLPMILAYILISGGVLAFGLIILRRVIESLLLLRPSGENVSIPKLFIPGEDVPYGAAIALGAVVYAPELSLLTG